MKRQPELEQIHRLSVNTLDQVFVARALEGLGCSWFEAKTGIIRSAMCLYLAHPTITLGSPV